jgi:threonine synthase
MISCQSDGCAPIARAFELGERFAPKFENARTIASGVRVPVAVGDFMILDAARASGGTAVAVPESGIEAWMRKAISLEGLSICPEAAVCLGALEMLLARGDIKPHEKIVVFNTGAAQKYPEAVHESIPLLDIRSPIDWDQI